jgi:hypothetical protein
VLVAKRDAADTSYDELVREFRDVARRLSKG